MKLLSLIYQCTIVMGISVSMLLLLHLPLMAQTTACTPCSNGTQQQVWNDLTVDVVMYNGCTATILYDARLCSPTGASNYFDVQIKKITMSQGCGDALQATYNMFTSNQDNAFARLVEYFAALSMEKAFFSNIMHQYPPELYLTWNVNYLITLIKPRCWYLQTLDTHSSNDIVPCGDDCCLNRFLVKRHSCEDENWSIISAPNIEFDYSHFTELDPAAPPPGVYVDYTNKCEEIVVDPAPPIQVVCVTTCFEDLKKDYVNRVARRAPIPR